eukprot:TRINITY_DN14356_c0_g3_i2.p1 TRINITY_DN14356_c0_g3~~TRINITY_DN14356_c0_g3_i2.p1  ORF type:complete len:318 (-),score=72.53 TRINITY_DN14356_c0_g3_i2:208-1119(-)
MMAATAFDTMGMTGGCSYAWSMAPGTWAVPMMQMAPPVAAAGASGAAGGPVMMPQVPENLAANNALLQSLQAVLGSQGTSACAGPAAAGAAPSARAMKRQRARERRRLGKQAADDGCSADQGAVADGAVPATGSEPPRTRHVEVPIAMPRPRSRTSFSWAEAEDEDEDSCSVAPSPPSCASRNSSPSRPQSSSGRSSSSTPPLSPEQAGDAAFQAPTSKVTVKHTFIDIEDLDTDDDASPKEQALPAPTASLGLGADFDEYRRAYRRFRLGHHRGARGEAADVERSEKVPDADAFAQQACEAR